MSESGFQYPALTPELSGRPNWRMLKFFGAGAILASITIGSGETLFAARGGAIFGYALLWCFVGGAIMKAIQVYVAARYMTLTGEHPMTHWGQLPGPRNWVPIVIGVLSLLCFPFWLAALPRILGELINWIFGIGTKNGEQFDQLARIWATIAIVVAVTLTWLQTYQWLERVQTVIVVLLLLSILVACVVSRPDWLAALSGTFIPTLPDYEDWLRTKYPDIAKIPPWVEIGVYLGAIGGGTYDYIGYIGCLREKKWGAIGQDTGANQQSNWIDNDSENIRRARRWLLPAKIDVGVSFLCLLIFTVCFVLLGAAILHPKELVPNARALLSHQASFLHPSLLYVYQVGIFMAFWGTIYGAYEIYSRTAYECIIPLSPRLRAMPMRRVRLAVLLYCGALGLILLWIVDRPENLVKPAAIVGGVFTCGLWCFAMIWTDKRFVPSPLRMGWGLWLLTMASGAVLTALGAKALWDYIEGLVSG